MEPKPTAGRPRKPQSPTSICLLWGCITFFVVRVASLELVQGENLNSANYSCSLCECLVQGLCL